MRGFHSAASANIDGFQNISDLAPYVSNVRIVGVVIARSSVKTFQGRGGMDFSAFNFVLRDSVVDTVNVSVKGTARFTGDVFCITELGSIVIVDHPDVISNGRNSSARQYLPATTSEVNLTVREGSGFVLEFTGDTQRFVNFLRIPTQPDVNVTSLSEILALGKADLEETRIMNILAIVKQVGVVRRLNKGGSAGNSCVAEVLFMDESLGGSGNHLRVEFWGASKAYQTMSWTIGTIVMVSSLGVRWDGYRNNVKATVGERAIVIVDPISRRANRLLAFTPHAGLLNYSLWDAVPPSGVGELNGTFHLISDFLKVLQSWVKNPSRETTSFIAWVYGMPAGLDLSRNIVRRLCVNCKRGLKWGRDVCISRDCIFSRMSEEDVLRCLAPLERDTELPRVLFHFNFLTKLMDETGGIKLQVSGIAAREALGVTEDEFVRMDDERRKAVLQNFAFEEWKVLVRLRVPTVKSFVTKQAKVSDFLACVAIRMEKLSGREFTDRRSLLSRRGVL